MDLTGDETLPSNQGSIKAQAKFSYFRPSICWSRRRLDKMSSKKSFRLLQDVLEDKKLLRGRCFQDMSWSRLADFLENNKMFTGKESVPVYVIKNMLVLTGVLQTQQQNTTCSI